MAFDFTVLCLTGWKLAFPANGRSKLIKLIFGDGLIYFAIAYVRCVLRLRLFDHYPRFLANLIATIFMLVNLNAVLSIIANVPAAIASTVCANVVLRMYANIHFQIVACRVVRRLTNFTSQGPEVFTYVFSPFVCSLPYPCSSYTVLPRARHSHSGATLAQIVAFLSRKATAYMFR